MSVVVHRRRTDDFEWKADSSSSGYAWLAVAGVYALGVSDGGAFFVARGGLPFVEGFVRPYAEDEDLLKRAKETAVLLYNHDVQRVVQ